MMAQEAAVTEIAKIKLRRLVAYNKSLNRTNVQSGNSLLFTKLRIVNARHASAARRRSSTSTKQGRLSGSKVKLSRWRGNVNGKRWTRRMRGKWTGTLPLVALGENQEDDRLFSDNSRRMVG